MSGSAGENRARLGGSLLYWACWTSTTTMLLHSVLQWLTLVYSQTSTNGHLSIMGTSLQRPFFWRTFHTFTLVSTSLQWTPLNNGHFLLSPRWPLMRGSTVVFWHWFNLTVFPTKSEWYFLSFSLIPEPTALIDSWMYPKSNKLQPREV